MELPYGIVKSKNPYFLLNKIINFNKNETESKMERWILCFSAFKNRELKVKLWWVGDRLFYQEEVFLTFAFYLNEYIE